MKNKKVIFILSVLTLLVYDFSIAANKSIEPNYVPDKKTAIKIAEAIWLPIYGKLIYRELPFKAHLKDNKVWIVNGTIKEEKGGVAYIEIQKSDCKVLKVTHGK